MPNLKSHIKASNMRKWKPIKDDIEDLECTCIIENTTCPVNGECKVKNVIYEAKLKSRNNLKIYTGMTGRQIITRIKEHKANFKYKQQKGTKLSSYAHK